MSLFGQSLCQTQISILELLHIFLWLKFSSFLTLAKIELFLKVSSEKGERASESENPEELHFL
jgi:hypothetical protein